MIALSLYLGDARQGNCKQDGEVAVPNLTPALCRADSNLQSITVPHIRIIFTPLGCHAYCSQQLLANVDEHAQMLADGFAARAVAVNELALPDPRRNLRATDSFQLQSPLPQQGFVAGQPRRVYEPLEQIPHHERHFAGVFWIAEAMVRAQHPAEASILALAFKDLLDQCGGGPGSGTSSCGHIATGVPIPSTTPR